MLESMWSIGYKFIFIFLFVIGAGLFWIPLLLKLNFRRTSRLALFLDRVKEERQETEQHLLSQEILTVKEITFYEKARLAGMPVELTYSRFKYLRVLIVGLLLIFGFMLYVPNLDMLIQLTFSSWLFLIFKLLVIAILGWSMPVLVVTLAAAQRKSRYLTEISKLSHRLSICVSEKADIRDMFLRAGRPLKLLKPHLQEMSALWGKNQKAAIQRFKESVGISEVYPLVNALTAISEAESKDVIKVLQEQTKSIDATLESDVNRKLENAPIWISLYIMIPFGAIIVLFIYPWVITVKSQLLTSYTQP